MEITPRYEKFSEDKIDYEVQTSVWDDDGKSQKLIINVLNDEKEYLIMNLSADYFRPKEKKNSLMNSHINEPNIDLAKRVLTELSKKEEYKNLIPKKLL